MGADRADVSRSAPQGTSAHDLPAQGDGRDFVYCIQRMCVADVAQLLSSDLNGARLFLRLAGQAPRPALSPPVDPRSVSRFIV